jgi:hypothetical protein
MRRTRDGQFLEEGLLSGVSWNQFDYSEQAQAIREVPRGSGSYEIRDNTLRLRYRDGRVIGLSIYIFPEELAKRQPEEIYINSFDLKRVQ